MHLQGFAGPNSKAFQQHARTSTLTDTDTDIDADTDTNTNADSCQMDGGRTAAPTVAPATSTVAAATWMVTASLCVAEL
jgi:hypothetical protein